MTATPSIDRTHNGDSFVHIADLHFWHPVYNPALLLGKRFLGNINVLLRRRHEFVMDRVNDHIAKIASVGLRRVILTGDFTSTSTAPEFRMGRRFVEHLVSAGLDPVAIAGNHDVYTFSAARLKRFESYFGSWMPAPRLPARVALENGTSVVFAPTVRPNIISSKGDISDEEIARTAELVAAADSPVVVAAHYPILNRTPGYEVRPTRRLLNADALRRALGESSKHILYLCGHVHRFSYVRDPQFPNVEHLSTGAFFRTAPESASQGEFSEVHVRRDGFEIVRHLRRDTGEWVSSRESLPELEAATM